MFTGTSPRARMGILTAVAVGCAVLGAAAQASRGEGAPAAVTGDLNVKDFAHLAQGDDWSPAIQAAIDTVNSSNGLERGRPSTSRRGSTAWAGR